MKNLGHKTKWLLLLTVGWLILTAGDAISWAVGIPFIAMALLLLPRSEISQDNRAMKKNLFSSLFGFIQFSCFFIVESIRGGIDVSRRVLAHQPDVDPAFFDYSMQLQLPASQAFLMASVNLLPGTLSADLINNQLRIHSLDQHTDNTQGVKRLERLVGKIFGENL